jgi:hypothetical protein
MPGLRRGIDAPTQIYAQIIRRNAGINKKSRFGESWLWFLLCIAGSKDHVVLCGCNGIDDVNGPESMRQRIRFDINQGAMADVFR